jgi:uncharacterized membrane protein YeaQ/YmgE (transglycosylase-associated protein family)
VNQQDPQGPVNSIKFAIVAAVAASVASVIVLLLMGVDTQPAVIAGVVGAVVGSTIPTFAKRR